MGRHQRPQNIGKTKQVENSQKRSDVIRGHSITTWTRRGGVIRKSTGGHKG